MPSFFKPGKPKGFRYEPRYYDERKEELEQRVERIKREMGMSESAPGSSIRGSFRDARRAKPKNIFSSTGAMGKIIRIVTILLIAFMLYFVFQAVGLMIKQQKPQQQQQPRVATEYVE